jgi:hypothetical protein
MARKREKDGKRKGGLMHFDEKLPIVTVTIIR